MRARNIFMIMVIALLFVAGIAVVPTQTALARCPKFPHPCSYDPTKEDPPFFAEDDRVNPQDPLASTVGYCKPDNSIDVWGVGNSEGKYLFTVTGESMLSFLNKAVAANKSLLIKEAGGHQLVAGAGGDLILHDAAGY